MRIPTHIRIRKSALLILMLAVVISAPSTAQTTTSHWVGTWAAGPAAQWMPAATQTIAPTTFRNVVHTNIGGDAIRVKLTNELGVDPLTIGEASLGISGGGGTVVSGTQQTLTFSGKTSVTIPIGSVVISDPVQLTMPAFSDLAVSIYLPQQLVRCWSLHPDALSTNYEAPGNQADQQTFSGGTAMNSWYFLKAIDVDAPGSFAIVTLGDSITDGYKSTIDANHRWPDFVATRMAATGRTTPVSVLNVGMGGNRLLGTGAAAGISALARLDRDVLTQSGVKYLIVLEGINDIYQATNSSPVSSEDLILGMSQIITHAHEVGIKVYGATLTPAASRLTTAGEAQRQALNLWIRTGGAFDGFFDFEAVTRNPASPGLFLKIYDSGDHLHPNDAGYNVMAQAVALSSFK